MKKSVKKEFNEITGRKYWWNRFKPIDWYCISIYQTLSEDFMREFKDNVHWAGISIYQKLSESFMREFRDKLDWYWMCRKQNLSYEFISEFRNRLEFDILVKRKLIDQDQIDKMYEPVSKYELLDI